MTCLHLSFTPLLPLTVFSRLEYREMIALVHLSIAYNACQVSYLNLTVLQMASLWNTQIRSKREISNIIRTQAAKVSKGQKATREDICLQLRNRSPVWLEPHVLSSGLDILFTQQPHCHLASVSVITFLVAFPYCLGTVEFLCKGAVLFLLPWTGECRGPWCSWEGGQISTLQSLSDAIQCFVQLGFLPSCFSPRVLLCSPLTGTRKMFSIIFFLFMFWLQVLLTF